jgi:hypothetical protein
MKKKAVVYTNNFNPNIIKSFILKILILNVCTIQKVFVCYKLTLALNFIIKI